MSRRALRILNGLPMVVLLLSTAVAAHGQIDFCNGGAICMTDGAMMYRTCQDTMNLGTTRRISSINTVVTGGATRCQVLNGPTGPVVFSARRPLANQATAACSWTGTIRFAPSGSGVPVSFVCRIDQTDTLPVELMDFAVDPPEEANHPAPE